MINLTIKQITEDRNGWGMPKIIVTSDKDLTIVNRGYNEFESTEEVSEANLKLLLEHFKDTKEDTLFLEIEQPTKKNTCCWFNLRSSDFYGNRITW